MSAAAGETRDFAARLAQAVELREDGEPEESAEIFAALLADGGGDALAALEYAKTLRKLERVAEAEQVLSDAIPAEPDHFELRRAWAELPQHDVNYEATIARGRILRETFPPERYPDAWESLSVEFDCHYEMGHWHRLEEIVQANWDRLTAHPEIIPGAIAALNKLFRADILGRLAREAAPEAWRHLPPGAQETLRERCDIAAVNLAAIERTGIRLISIGQNCLPYQLAGRWGLIAPRAEAAALTPFDLGGFGNDSVAEAIATDFAAFERRENFDVTKAWGGGEMFIHRPSGVGFFHERGTYWVTPDRARFHTRLALMLTNWQLAKRAAKKLYVFCYCGAGDLELLVRTAAENLLGPSAHLLVIDVLQQRHECPAGPFVTYRHLPYPRDYDWTSVYQQCSAAGLQFERSVIEAIGWAMVGLDPAAQAALPYLRPRDVVSPPELARADLIDNIWSLGNRNGHILAAEFCFGASGLVESYHNDNEHSWALEDGGLRIFRRDGGLMWAAETVLKDESGAWHIRLRTHHNPDLDFYLTQAGPRPAAPAAAAQAHRYTGRRRVLVLRSGLEIERRLIKTLAGAEVFFINDETEIEKFPDCNVFIADLVLTHARTPAQAAGFIARITSRFPVAIFLELSGHDSGYLAASGLQSFHRSFDENTFMDALNLDFVAGAASPSVYKVEHFADVPAFDSFKDWIVSNAHPKGTFHAAGSRGAYQIFDRPVFEISVYTCHGFEALDVALQDDLTLLEMRTLRFRAASSGFRLDHVAHPRDLGPLLYNTLRDAPAAWRNRPISIPVMFEDKEAYQDPRHQALLDQWRGEFKIEIAELSVYEIKDCVIGGTGTLFAGGRFVWGTDYLLMFMNSSSLDPIMRGLQRRHPVQHIEGMVVCGFNALYDNYYHFVAEALATMSLCIELLAARNLPRITLVTGKLNKTRRDYLDLLLQGDPRYDVVDLDRGEFVTADTVIYCDNLGRVVYQQVCWEEAPLAEKLIAAAGLQDVRPHRRLYVARTDTKGRAMRNEAALIERLANMGFTIFVGSEHTVAEQMRHFREAALIVAPHGAGLTNVLFCHPGIALLELQQSGYVNTGMMRLAQLTNLRYFSEVFFPDETDSFEDSWVVDVAHVVELIGKISQGDDGPF